MCRPLLSLHKTKFITHYNWKKGRCKKSNKFEIKLSRLPSKKCLQMTKNTVWLCENACLLAYNRSTKNGTIRKNKKAFGITNSHISDVAYCNNIIISGHADGSIRHWKIESQNETNHVKQLKEIHDVVRDELRQIDATPQHIITSYYKNYFSNSIKIQKNTHEIDDFVEKTQIFHRDQYYANSILFDPVGTKFAANFLVNENRFPNYYSGSLFIYDIDKCHSVMDKKYDNYFIQLLWQDPNTILLLDNDYIKKMDIRISEFVHTWDASFVRKNNFRNGLSCFSSDNLYTIMTGTYVDDIILWDQRQSAIIQKYNVIQNNDRIWSVQFDSTHMYAVTSANLVEFDFKGKDVNRANKKNFCQFLKNIK